MDLFALTCRGFGGDLTEKIMKSIDKVNGHNLFTPRVAESYNEGHRFKVTVERFKKDPRSNMMGRVACWCFYFLCILRRSERKKFTVGYTAFDSIHLLSK